MTATPIIDTQVTAASVGEPLVVPQEKSWEEFDACERCHGQAHIEETADGDLFCELCRAHLPRPSS